MIRSFLVAVLGLLPLVSCRPGAAPQTDPAVADVVAFVGANVLPMTGPDGPVDDAAIGCRYRGASMDGLE